MNDELKRIHLEIMIYTQDFRMRHEKPPTVFISRELYDAILDSFYGEHFSKMLNGLTYFGMPCKVEPRWKGIRYIVGFEGGIDQ